MIAYLDDDLPPPKSLLVTWFNHDSISRWHQLLCKKYHCPRIYGFIVLRRVGGMDQCSVELLYYADVGLNYYLSSELFATASSLSSKQLIFAVFVSGGPPNCLFIFAENCNFTNRTTDFSRASNDTQNCDNSNSTLLYTPHQSVVSPSILNISSLGTLSLSWVPDGLSTYRRVIYPNKLSTDLFTLKFTHYRHCCCW